MDLYIIPFLLFFLLNLIFLNSPSVDAAKIYEYHVVGQLFCDGKPWANQDVDLYDLDCYSNDDHLASGKTDAEGQFELRGQEKDDWGIESRLGRYTVPTPYIYTSGQCNARLYLIRHQKEHNIQVYMSGARAYAKYADGKPYPECDETCNNVPPNPGAAADPRTVCDPPP